MWCVQEKGEACTRCVQLKRPRHMLCSNTELMHTCLQYTDTCTYMYVGDHKSCKFFVLSRNVRGWYLPSGRCAEGRE